ncbi:MAG: hypothetical protein JWM57_8 [Phycisphaerales bacterium]|nr:hypothetical protein [Phycisphaerales bacterium]
MKGANDGSVTLVTARWSPLGRLDRARCSPAPIAASTSSSLTFDDVISRLKNPGDLSVPTTALSIILLGSDLRTEPSAFPPAKPASRCGKSNTQLGPQCRPLDSGGHGAVLGAAHLPPAAWSVAGVHRGQCGRSERASLSDRGRLTNGSISATSRWSRCS